MGLWPITSEQVVAPHAGAWIETRCRMDLMQTMRQSRPTRARGLKQVRALLAHVTLVVAPHAGAWIETE